jgi:diguanylate cyclase (GGDEF)-like protein/PAS domain S-box-containing protein
MQENIHTQKASLDNELLRVEGHYRSLLEDVSEIVQIVTPGGAFLYVNKAWRECFGYEGSILSLLSLSDLISPRIAKEAMGLFRKALLEHKIESTELEFVNRNGKIVCLEGSITPLHKNGKAHATLGIFRDITERKKNDESLSKSAAYNKAIVEALPDLMFLQSADGTFLDCKASENGMYLLPPKEMIGKNMKDIMPTQVVIDLSLIFDKVFITGQTCTYEYELIINGKFRHFEAHLALCDKDHILSLVRDVTEQKKVVEAALEQQRRYHELIELGHGYIITLDMRGYILSINRVAALSLGYVPEDLLGRSFFEVFLKNDKGSFSGYIEQLKDKRATSGTIKVLTKRGEERYWRYHNVLCDDLGGGYYVLSHAQDITDLKRAEEEIRNLSLTDELTQLRNRRGFMLLAEQQLKLSRKKELLSAKEHTELLLLFIDLDELKKINDRYGHNEGDIAIQEASEILKSTFRDSDILARLGGDEFTVLIVDAENGTEEIIRERLNHNIDLANKRLNKPYQLSMSAGLIRIPANSSATIEELMEYADMVMYDEKSAKKQSQIQ